MWQATSCLKPQPSFPILNLWAVCLSQDVWLRRATEFSLQPDQSRKRNPDDYCCLLSGSLLRCSNCKRTKKNIQLICQHLHQMFPLSKLDESQFSMMCSLKLISSQMETSSCLGDALIVRTIHTLSANMCLFYETHKSWILFMHIYIYW